MTHRLGPGVGVDRFLGLEHTSAVAPGGVSDGSHQARETFKLLGDLHTRTGTDGLRQHCLIREEIVVQQVVHVIRRRVLASNFTRGATGLTMCE